MGFFTRTVRPFFHQEFFEQVAEAINGACAGAHMRSMRAHSVLPVQRPYAEGSDRYFAIQAAVMDVTASTGGEAIMLRASGFPIPVGKHQRYIVTACVTDSLDKLKRSKARRLLARFNGALEPYQHDLFEAEPPTSASPLFGVLIIARPKRGVPPAIYFGVPSTSLQSWHFYEEIGTIIAMYDSVDDHQAADGRRGPKLRRVARSSTLPGRRRA